MLRGIVEPSHQRQRSAEIAVRLGILRPEYERPLEQGNRLGKLARSEVPESLLVGTLNVHLAQFNLYSTDGIQRLRLEDIKKRRSPVL